jgi:predicted transcriptional regulator
LLLTRQKYQNKANRQALHANNLQYQVHKIKVPVFILNSSVTSKKQYKLYATFLAFKALEKSSIILDYTTKAANIAALFGISKSKLDKQIKSLVNIGLVSKSLKNLIIAPYSKLYELHPAQGKSYCYVKVKPYSPTEYALTTKKISRNLEKQAYKVINKIKRFNDGCTDSQAKQLLQEYMQSIIKAFKDNTSPDKITPPGNLDISISQAKLAILLGLKSQTSGYYWQQRLQALHYLTVNSRQLVSANSTRVQDSPKFGRWGYNNKQKVSFITMPNSLVFQ